MRSVRTRETMPITVNGIPLVSHGQVNRQVLGASEPATYYQLHPRDFELARTRPTPALTLVYSRPGASSQAVATTPR